MYQDEVHVANVMDTIGGTREEVNFSQVHITRYNCIIVTSLKCFISKL